MSVSTKRPHPHHEGGGASCCPVSVPRATLTSMWRYQLVDWPLDGSEGDLETWCQRLADDGWQLWDAGSGATIEQEGRTVHRISVRRDTSRVCTRTHVE